MKIGFIGCGNMASAIMGGIIKEKVFAPADIYGTDALPAAVEKAVSQFGIQTALDNRSEEHTSELQSPDRHRSISYAVLWL